MCRKHCCLFSSRSELSEVAVGADVLGEDRIPALVEAKAVVLAEVCSQHVDV